MPYQEYSASHSLRYLHCNARTICLANRLPSKSGAHRPATERSLAPVLTHGVSMPGSVGDDVNAAACSLACHASGAFVPGLRSIAEEEQRTELLPGRKLQPS